MATTDDPTVTATDFYASTLDTTTNNNSSPFDYDDDYKDEACNQTNILQTGNIFTPVFFSTVVILSLVGNILVIVILAKYENLRSLTNTFILNLAISDLLFTAGLPFWAYYHMYGWTFGDLACKIVIFTFYAGYYSSGILLILMTAHRYVAVMNPLSDIVSTKGLYSVLASLVIWAVSAMVTSPMIIFTADQGHNTCGFVDSFWHLWSTYQQNVLFILSSVIFIFCYSQIIHRLLRPSTRRRKSRTLKLIFTLIAVFFGGWGPYNIVIFLQSLNLWSETLDQEDMAESCEMSKRLNSAFYFTRVLAFSYCCLNPVLYVFVGVKFKNHLKKMLKSWGHSSSTNTRSRISRITSVTSGEEMSAL